MNENELAERLNFRRAEYGYLSDLEENLTILHKKNFSVNEVISSSYTWRENAQNINIFIINIFSETRGSILGMKKVV